MFAQQMSKMFDQKLSGQPITSNESRGAKNLPRLVNTFGESTGTNYMKRNKVSPQNE